MTVKKRDNINRNFLVSSLHTLTGGGFGAELKYHLKYDKIFMTQFLIQLTHLGS